MKYLFLVLVILFVGCDNRKDSVNHSDTTWLPLTHDSNEVPTSYEEAIVLSNQHSKPLLLVFFADWCTPCRKMKAEVWSDSAVQAEMKRFIVYKVNVDQEPGVAGKHNVQGIPAYGIYDCSNGMPERIKQDSGFRSVRGLLDWLS